MKKTFIKKNRIDSKNFGRYFGLLLFLLILFFCDFESSNKMITRMSAVAVLMATWWITDAIPLFATALLPLILFPLLGIQSGKATAPIYINSTIFLFIGGFMIALVMEKWNLHKRIALLIINAIGSSPSKITLGFLLSSAFLSMWISNTATAIMMMPIGLSIILKIEEEFGKNKTHKFSVGLLLSIAYGCSLGGIATLVGTPPNLSFSRIFQITFPNAEVISFSQWLMVGLPISIIMIFIVWFLITKVFYKSSKNIFIEKKLIANELKKLGKISFEEKAVLIVFISTALLWIFRKKIDLSFLLIPGWSEILPFPKFIDDGTVAIFMAFIMFFIPAKSSVSKEKIMGVDILKKLPWEIVLLFGGGFALAKGFQVSGLSQFIGQQFSSFNSISPLIIIIFISLTITFLTELTSNTATTEMILPVIASVAVALQINPLLLMIPATISASCAFMMPVATPPNAIVFGSNRLKISEMAKIGILINLLGVIIISLLFYFLSTQILGIDINTFPNWANFVK